MRKAISIGMIVLIFGMLFLTGCDTYPPSSTPVDLVRQVR